MDQDRLRQLHDDLLAHTSLIVVVVIVLSPILWWLACAFIAAVVAADKGRSGIGFFFLALVFLGPFAIAVAILATPLAWELAATDEPVPS